MLVPKLPREPNLSPVRFLYGIWQNLLGNFTGKLPTLPTNDPNIAPTPLLNAIWKATQNGGGGGGSPTGPAGGDLSGTYPNPTLAIKGSGIGDVPYYPNAPLVASRLFGTSLGAGGQIQEVAIGDGLRLDSSDPNVLKIDPAITRINVKLYGAKGDARKVVDAVLNGTTTVTSATANFTSADVGKIVWAVDYAGGYYLNQTTIVSVTNSTTIEVADAASGSVPNMILVLGTDDSDAIIAANAAALASPSPAAVYIPAGGYIYSKLIFDHGFASPKDCPAIIGDGAASTIFFESPEYDYGTTVNFQATFNKETNANNARWSGFTVDGCRVLRDYVHHAVLFASGPMSVRRDIAVINFVHVTSGVVTVGSQEVFINLYVRYCDAIGVQVNGTPTFVDCYVGDCISDGINTSGCDLFRWRGGVLDESTGGSAVFNSCAEIFFSDALIYAPSGAIAIDLLGTSGLHAVNCDIRPFGSHPDSTAVRVASGSRACFSNCNLTGSGTGYGLNNAGAVLVGGTNVINTLNGNIPVMKLVGYGSNLEIYDSEGGTLRGGFSLGRWSGIDGFSAGNDAGFGVNGYNGVSLKSSLGIQWSSDPTFYGTPDLFLSRSAAGILALLGAATGAAIEVAEMAEPAAPAANKARIFIEDDGAGKTRLMVRFPSGASQQIAIEP